MIESRIEARVELRRTVLPWHLRRRSLELGRRTLVMGVVNITPDSFSDGGSFLDPEAAVAHGLRLLDEGAHLLDLGGESTKPGTRVGREEATVSADEEQARLLPVLEAILRVRPEAVISVDTYKAATAHAALEAGAEIINDVSGFGWDAGLAKVCAEFACGVVLMHTRGRPDAWREQAMLRPAELMTMVRAGLEGSMAAALAAGVRQDAIVLDPGYGFGKKYDENYALLARQAELLPLGNPLLVGVSRKSFLGRTLAPLRGGKVAPAEARATASIAAMVTAILHGASIVRVHAVREAVEAALIADAVLAGGQG